MQGKMRIAIIADFGLMGGTRTYFGLLADLLHSEGHELVGLVPCATDGDDAFAPLMQKKFRAWQTLPHRSRPFFMRQPFAAFWNGDTCCPLFCDIGRKCYSLAMEHLATGCLGFGSPYLQFIFCIAVC